MLWFYLIASAALIPISNIFFDVLQQSYSWWLVPVLYVGFVLCFIVVHLLAFVISIWLIRLNSPHERFSNFYRRFIEYTLPLLFTLVRVRVEVSGAEKVPTDSRFLLVCNHLHNIDPAVLVYAFPWARLGFIGKKEIYTTMPFVARAMHKLHCLPLDRENNREAVKSIVEAARLIKEDIVSMCIFPEGHVSENGELQPFRNGAFKIAYKAKVPIVVCTVDNTALAIKNLFRKKTVIHLDVLDVVSAQRLESSPSNEVGDMIFEQMQKNIAFRRTEKQ